MKKLFYLITVLAIVFALGFAPCVEAYSFSDSLTGCSIDSNKWISSVSGTNTIAPSAGVGVVMTQYEENPTGSGLTLIHSIAGNFDARVHYSVDWSVGGWQRSSLSVIFDNNYSGFAGNDGARIMMSRAQNDYYGTPWDGENYAANFAYIGRNPLISDPFVVPYINTTDMSGWLRITRIGNTYTGYYSEDGLHWTIMDSYTSTMPFAQDDIHLALDIWNDAGPQTLSKTTFSDFSVKSVPEPTTMLLLGLGLVGLAGVKRKFK